jgi:CheY-like chemotaxis protein
MQAVILAIDDNRQFIDLIKAEFEPQFTVDSAATAEEGLIKAGECRPAIILLDINLPGMSGVDFLRQMARKESLRGIPVLVITASDYNGVTESLVRDEPNVAGFLTKLLPMNTLREKILASISAR